MNDEQHDDHVWLTFYGEGWAIRSIERKTNNTTIFHLWRGYEPCLEFCACEMIDPDWNGYCEAAIAMLQQEYGD